MDGVKLSVLDAGREVALRRRLPAGVRLYTGDDFGYLELIRGDAAGAQRRAARGVRRDHGAGRGGAGRAGPGRPGRIRRGDGPTVALSRLIFEPPTYYYKVGVAFLAWLNGFQPQFAMLGGLQRRRPARHLIRVFELAAAARALTDPDLAVERMN